jgi:adenine-specific DNA-methyltransferase
MSKVKTKGEVFTGQFIIDFMLGKTYDPISMNYVLEPGCGDGRFITSIIKILIETFGDNHQTLNDKIEKLYGIEIDDSNYNAAVNNINNLLSQYEYIVARPTILHGDALLNDYVETIKFDFIVGNPPYIRIHNLPKDYLTVLQSKYNFLKNGMVDIYYGFIELYKKSMNENGTLCFITPNSYLINTSSENLIEEIYKDRMFNQIYDFKSEKLFDGAATYTCITILRKTDDEFKYTLADREFNTLSETVIQYNDQQINFLNEIQNNSTGKRFSELYKVKTGFATLADKIFVLTEFVDNGDTLTFQKNGLEYTIEKSATKFCVKASKFDGNYHRVIFPYKKENGRNVVMTEEELIANYPLTHAYLNEYKSKLLTRDKGKKDVKYKWYEWGRSQALNNVDGKKIAISTIFENNPFVFIDEDTLIYSGYFIITDNDDIFTNKQFLDSLKSISKPVSKGWFSLQKKILDNVIIK